MAEPDSATSAPQSDYTTWTNDRLVDRVLELERQLRERVSTSNIEREASLAPEEQQTTTTISHPAATPKPDEPATTTKPAKKPKVPKPFDPSKYSTRLVALRFAYLGRSYNGFEHHANNTTPLPTIEEELWKALVRSRLIFPPSLAKNGLDRDLKKLDAYENGATPVDWDGCEYSKCGRTDKGVSAFGQVIGIRVRSARKLVKRVTTSSGDDVLLEQGESRVNDSHRTEDKAVEEEWVVDENDGFDPIKDELPYITLLNRVLPPTIRMLALCVDLPANFSARFSCKEREYRYFFTNPAYLPIPTTEEFSQSHTATLNIEAMREAASYLVGSHDFRNMCKIDGSKQLTEFTRSISSATVEFQANMDSPQLPNYTRWDTTTMGQPALYAFRFHGSAFLWHQVRCMVAVLFLVGQGLEKPAIVKELLDVENCKARPVYEMADDQPLVLWHCKFSATYGKLSEHDTLDRPLWDRGTGDCELKWINAGEGPVPKQFALCTKWGRSGIMEDLWQNWRSSKMDEILASQLMDNVALREGINVDETAVAERDRMQRIFSGDKGAPAKGQYVPVMQRERLESVESVNARWAERKGTRPRGPRDDIGENVANQDLGS